MPAARSVIVSVLRLGHAGGMPRWLEVTLTLVLFAALMLAAWAALKFAVPWALTPIGERIGWWPTSGLLFCLMAALCGFAIWPRDETGRMRSLSRRR